MTIELLRTACADNRVVDVALIDDVFDPPSPRHLDRAKYRVFLSAVGDPATRAKLDASASGGVPLPDEMPDFQDLEERDVAPFWDLLVRAEADGAGMLRAGSGLDAIRALFEGHKHNPLAMLESVARICKLFKEQLGCRVERYGREPDYREVATKDLVLLDFFLEQDQQFPAALEQTKDVVRRIRAAKRAGAPQPSFILVSTRPADIDSERFRAEAALMRSRFRFISKDDLGRGDGKHLVDLHDVVEAQSKAAHIEMLVDDWREAVRKAADDVHARMLDFDVPDFVYLDRYRLYREGTSLGAYLRWLMTAYAQSKVVAHLDKATWSRAEGLRLFDVDGAPTGRTDGDRLVKAFEGPSDAIADAYFSVVVDQSRSSDHPFPSAQRHDDLLEGDLFLQRRAGVIEDGAEVLLTMTPSCDLTVRGGGKVPTAANVLFLPGTLKSLKADGKTGDLEFVRVPAVDGEGKETGRITYTVKWDLKAPRSVSWTAIVGGHLAELERIGRLREPYFNDVRETFAKSMTRVGWEVTPLSPVARGGEVCVKVAVAGKKSRQVPLFTFAASDGYVWMFQAEVTTPRQDKADKSDEKELFHATRKFLERLDQELAKARDLDGDLREALVRGCSSLDLRVALRQPGIQGMRGSQDAGCVFEVRPGEPGGDRKSPADLLLVVFRS